ncbi:MAG: 3'-5' exonuclease [Kiritimatiellia bacterium]
MNSVTKIRLLLPRFAMAGFICIFGIHPRCTASPLENITFAAFDTETTGFSPRSARIVEIAAVKFRGGNILESRSWLINPGIPIPESSRRVHGISDKMVADAPGFGAVFPEFIEFTEGAVLLAHNAGFDVRFLRAEIERAGLRPPANEVLDTLRLFRGWFPEAEAHNLRALVEHLGVKAASFHRALADASYLAEIFTRGVSALPEQPSLKELEESAGGAMTFK